MSPVFGSAVGERTEQTLIIVHGLIPIKPESIDDAMDAARRMACATQTERGCISYDFYVGLTDPHTLLLFQEWENLEALQNHFETEHMEEFLAVLPSFAAGQIITRRFEVQSQGDPEPSDTDPPVIH